MRAPRRRGSRGSRTCSIQSLPHLLEGIDGLPTLLLWGKQDPVVPLSAAEVYQRSIKGSKVGDDRRLRALSRSREAGGIL